MDIYAGLLRNKIEDSLLSCFPISHGLLGERRWENLVEDFIARHRCLSPFYSQIPDEFINFLQHERSDPSDPPFLNELAHFEWMELVLAIAQAEEKPMENNGDLLKNRIIFMPVRTLLRYAYPVHRIGPEQHDWQKWQPWRQESFQERMQEETYVFGFRDRDDQAQFLEINAPRLHV
ncbi:putative DNA-binding domain-containing protein [Candidatus Methylospira mobilis]|uniref:HvfC family RiPP maturation protein n=1 Tax=Candidatus Methylospira mobilis TaxID=1808979 RepID=UPI0028E27AB0|nr:putative DNA-binding domain-containing protein [Candidatus Methylospira mobilis]WNV02996.1 putative DNA-binding domain-containing protein [Candidatus Methylospira mobilis]